MRNSIQFFLLTILITWIFWIPALLSSKHLVPELPDWFYLFGGLGPISAASIMAWKHNKLKGVSILYARVLVWKVKYYWYLLVLLLPLFIHYLILLIEIIIFQLPSDKISINLWSFFPAVVFTSVFMLVEEVGWRGYALPNLQKNKSALTSSFIIGIIWGIWHIPLLFYKPEQFGLHLFHSEILLVLLYIANTTVLSVLFTWIFNSTKGSLLLTTLFHGSLNTAGNTYSISGEFSPIHYWVSITIIFTIIASSITLMTNKNTLSKNVKTIWLYKA